MARGRGNRPDFEKKGRMHPPGRPGGSQKLMRERIVEGDDTLIEFGLNPSSNP